MGLSRNKVAVSEGAAGSPPFYGEREDMEISSYKRLYRENEREVVVRFAKTMTYGGVAQLGIATRWQPKADGVLWRNRHRERLKTRENPKHMGV